MRTAARATPAIFDVVKGTVAFVAAAVAKTGDMKITTPTATLGIRGTTGLVEVPEGAAANNPNNVAIKLYPDADGRVGRIEVNDRAGARLGSLTQGASGFTIRPGAGGARFAAVPLAIPQAMMQRDQGFVRQLHSTQNVGRQIVLQQREFRRANPGFVNPNRPNRQFQPGAPRQNGVPRPERPAGTTRTAAAAAGTEPSGPATTAFAGTSRHAAARGATAATGLADATRRSVTRRPAATARRANSTRSATASGQPPGSPAQPGQPPRAGQSQQPGSPNQPALPPRAGQPQQPAAPAQPGAPQGRPNRFGVPGLQRPPACSVRDCPRRRDGRHPRNGASRRRNRVASRIRGNSPSTQQAWRGEETSGRAAQPVPDSLKQVSARLPARALGRIDGPRLDLKRK